MSSNDPFFIVGSGRSGTTLLRLLLNGHSRIHIPPETWFLVDLIKELPLDRELSPVEVQRATKLITSSYRWPDMEMDAVDFERTAGTLAHPTLEKIVGLVYQTQLSRVGKARFGDKTPPYIHVIPQLLSLYPRARFIHLLRDGRDVALSFANAGESELNCRCYGGNFEWVRAIRRARTYENAVFSDRILTMRYETLVSTPEKAIREICCFLDEAFEPQMLQWQKQVSGVPFRERHIHSKLWQPISTANVESWRQTLSGWQCFVLESCMHDELQSVGYALRYNQKFLKPARAVTALVFKLLAPVLVRLSHHLRRWGFISKNGIIL